MYKNCESCVWFDQCREDEVCDYYAPMFTEEQDDIDAAIYEAELLERHEVYLEQVLEQDT